MTQKLDALHLEALCEEVSQEPCCYVSSFLPKFSSFSLHLYVRVCVCVCLHRTCSRESRSTPRWRWLIWF